MFEHEYVNFFANSKIKSFYILLYNSHDTWYDNFRFYLAVVTKKNVWIVTWVLNDKFAFSPVIDIFEK